MKDSLSKTDNLTIIEQLLNTQSRTALIKKMQDLHSAYFSQPPLQKECDLNKYDVTFSFKATGTSNVKPTQQANLIINDNNANSPSTVSVGAIIETDKLTCETNIFEDISAIPVVRQVAWDVLIRAIPIWHLIKAKNEFSITEEGQSIFKEVEYYFKEAIARPAAALITYCSTLSKFDEGEYFTLGLIAPQTWQIINDIKTPRKIEAILKANNSRIANLFNPFALISHEISDMPMSEKQNLFNNLIGIRYNAYILNEALYAISYRYLEYECLKREHLGNSDSSILNSYKVFGLYTLLFNNIVSSNVPDKSPLALATPPSNLFFPLKRDQEEIETINVDECVSNFDVDERNSNEEQDLSLLTVLENQLLKDFNIPAARLSKKQKHKYTKKCFNVLFEALSRSANQGIEKLKEYLVSKNFTNKQLQITYPSETELQQEFEKILTQNLFGDCKEFMRPYSINNQVSKGDRGKK